jgi:hypothetical protein
LQITILVIFVGWEANGQPYSLRIKVEYLLVRKRKLCGTNVIAQMLSSKLFVPMRKNVTCWKRCPVVFPFESDVSHADKTGIEGDCARLPAQSPRRKFLLLSNRRDGQSSNAALRGDGGKASSDMKLTDELTHSNKGYGPHKCPSVGIEHL